MRQRLLLGILSGFLAISQAHGQNATDEWFIKNDLYPISVVKQHIAKPGTLIAFLPGNTVVWTQTDDTIKPYALSFDVPGSQNDEALQVNAMARFLSVGLGVHTKAGSSIGVKQTTFEGVGWDDDLKEREDKILQPGTPTVLAFEHIQSQYSPVLRQVPVYFVQRVFSTADLEITNVKNFDLGFAANKDVPAGCTPVTVGHTGATAPTSSDSPNTSNPSTRSGPSAATPPPPPAPPQADVAPGGSLLICKGKGGRLTLKTDHQVPVAMSVCHVYYWEDDKSWNCEAVAKGITFTN